MMKSILFLHGESNVIRINERRTKLRQAFFIVNRTRSETRVENHNYCDLNIEGVKG